MIEIGKSKIIEKNEKNKSNILYLNSTGTINYFYESVRDCSFVNIVEKMVLRGYHCFLMMLI